MRYPYVLGNARRLTRERQRNNFILVIITVSFTNPDEAKFGLTIEHSVGPLSPTSAFEETPKFSMVTLR